MAEESEGPAQPISCTTDEPVAQESIAQEPAPQEPVPQEPVPQVAQEPIAREPVPQERVLEFVGELIATADLETISIKKMYKEAEEKLGAKAGRDYDKVAFHTIPRSHI
jgi:hypothetical protein